MNAQPAPYDPQLVAAVENAFSEFHPLDLLDLILAESPDAAATLAAFVDLVGPIVDGG
ncbi:hypothetical protein ACFV4E_22895 [Streptomyces hygroscopicus]|uniref:Uncharacterized protein n=1 Tax=Streptomyces hygroscopicus TaxID=1912 RepID=A0ABQ3UFI3_STRHY|nr:hypothetical protein [Streptomyces hygroscopicus]GHJ34319.1 hypothetical protein TPA0910_87520 [Streptomyces hygroscopicus]